MRWPILAVLAACAEPSNSACDPEACAANGQICEADACVDPWRYGSPTFGRCEASTRATPETLAQKAAGYDARLMALHVTTRMPWVMDVAIAPGVNPETAKSTDVTAWRSSENDGLWTGLALASQAYRYAVTHDPAARTAIAALLDGERTRMRITGVPGLFTRQLIPPGVAELTCPDDPAMYVPAPDKRGNKWVRIGSDGCIQTSNGTTFSSTTHCGLAEFADWCFLDNISQDEYVGHMFGLGAVARLVDDVQLRGSAIDMLDKIGAHLAANNMEFVDWDGRPTQWGKVHPGAEGDTPGYLAILGMSFLATSATATDNSDVVAKLDAILPSYLTYLDQIDIFSGTDGCTSNWNDISMLAASFHHLIWNRHAPDRAMLQARFASELVTPANTKSIVAQHNAWYDIMWAAMKPLGEGTDGPAFAAVEDAVCQLREFPRSNHVAARDTTQLAPQACTGRKDESLAAQPFGVADRCAATFVWWGNPYERRSCADEPTLIQRPAGYLLPYWMGRYYGFIQADQ